MLIGSMNNPKNSLIKEIKWIAGNFDFLDLTLELPKARPDKIRINEVRRLIEKKKLPVVGHTAWYLPIGSPFKELRVYALAELEKCAAVFEKLGVKKMAVHFDSSISIIKDKYIIDANIWSLRHLVKMCKSHGVSVMAENTPGLFSRPSVLGYVFRKVPKLLFHLDIAHANIAKKNQTPFILKRLSKKLAHVHVSGNHGTHDEHLPIEKGNINWTAMLGTLKKSGYDGTITLEVFTSVKDRLADKPKLRKIWNEL